MKQDRPHILLINPWIHDYAAYDFWAKPLGLLSLASMLRYGGIAVSYIDCLNRFHPKAPSSDPAARFGRGPYLKTPLPAPAGLEDVPRRFSRYGIRPEWLLEDLEKLPPPDLILVTSLMTYWYPGVQETIRALRSVWGATPIVLGGIYATLCREHAFTNADADWVASGSGEVLLPELVARFTGSPARLPCDPGDPDSFPFPALDLQPRLAYAPILTSRGCPFSCAYCASGILQPEFLRRSPEAVMEEIRHWHDRLGLVDFVFYDDALLIEPDRHAHILFEGIVRSGLNLRFHTPNALHIRQVGPETAALMRAAGFETVRLGLETTGFADRERLDQKVTAAEFRRAAGALRSAGFSGRQVGAYLLTGLPDQSLAAVADSIETVRDCGLTPILAHYTPIPGTALWPRAVETSRYDLEADPVFTNNAVSPCQKTPFEWQTISALKRLSTDFGPAS